MRKRITAISEEFMAALARHPWPGNVRELQNLIERSIILSTGDVLSGSLPGLDQTTRDRSKCSKTFAPVTLLEGQISHILQTLQETNGVIGGRHGAAARLGLPRTTLIHRMKRLGITAASVPTWESIPRTPPVSGISHEAARSRNSKEHSDVGKECTLADAEREQILEIAEMTDGLIDGEGGAAEALGVPPSTLRSRMKKLGIKLTQGYSMTLQQKLDDFKSGFESGAHLTTPQGRNRNLSSANLSRTCFSWLIRRMPRKL
jgi:formate hydrogenlyase transcriptional activator